MTEGKRKALELAEAARDVGEGHESFAGALFMGRFPLHLIYPFPEQPEADRAAGDAFLEKLGAFMRANVDPEEIDRTGEIPDEVVAGLAEMGAFGIKTPREYGGLGLSQTNYSRAAILAGGWDSNVAALLSAHQSIGVPTPLKMFGTKAQKEAFLPRTARGELSAFALTEADAGSDPARMTTRAIPTDDGEHYILNGEKLWCTNGTCAEFTPGVEVVHRSRFMGLRALYNASIRFTDVKVPAENIIWGTGRGLKVALSTLNTGRLTLPANCTGTVKRCVRIARKWAKTREQWGAPIGKHAAIADKIAHMTSTAFAMESMVLLASALVDKGGADIRLEAAMCKMFGSEASWRIVDETLQVRGGRGYETAESLAGRGEAPIPVERLVRDNRINMIFEGSSEIMRLLLAREALDPHLKVAGAVMDSRVAMGKRIAAAAKAGLFYAGWYPARWWPFPYTGVSGLHPKLAQHAGRAARRSQRLARRLFHAMARHRGGLEREQVLLGRFVDIGTELFAMAATISRAQSLLDGGENGPEAVDLADHFCQGALLRIGNSFRGLSRNADRQGYALAQRVLAGHHAWVERGTVHPSE
jgi:alkylation response protein AidB-like acyl-CoA dehydrogenase